MRPVRTLATPSLCAALLTCALAASPALAETWYVGGGSGCDTNSIQAAVDAAAQSQTSEQKIIDISSDQDYSAQAINVDNQDLEFFGGRLACNSLFTSDATIISGDGASGPVFNITGTSNIIFYNFELRDGNALTGGGINFSGNGSLVLSSTLIDFNNATYGGGVAASSGGSLDIYVNPETLILRNTAQNAGGGVELSGNTYFYALQPDTLIGYNNAPSGSGGGIDAVAPAQITLGSPGYNGLPVVFNNTAAYGGGIAMSGDGFNDFGGVLLFTMDSQNPVQVSGNGASIAGGGIYLKTLTNDLFPTAEICAQDFRINENFAPEGAAIYLDWDTVAGFHQVGSGAFLNPDDQSCDEESLGAVHCATGVACNEISGNVSADINGNPATGAVVLVGTSSDFSAKRTAMHLNVADNMIRTIGDNDNAGGVFLSNCLTGANQFAHELIHLQNDDNPVVIDQCTFAPDIINATHVIKFDNSGGNLLSLTNSIIDEPGTLTLSTPDTISLLADNLVTNDGTTLPTTPSIVVGEPQYVDIANHDYHLMPTSLGVDFAPAAGGVDLDGRTRDIDLPVKPNFLGPRDLGAYEVQPTCATVDTVFCDGFDGG